ncbi:uroporphyrinogen-III synthase [Pasteurellaceae bacterium 15-036681]|nr:uroporphyrinogen-III synthase [Pasteurellaceae bacterium 15-036681]
MNVLVTRPDNRGQQLVDLLVEQGIFAINQPLFTIEAGSELTQLPSILSRLNKGDCVFAVSKNAVDFAAETLKQTGYVWRSDLQYFAVGQGTANYFSAQIEQAVRYPIQSENSEGLLALPEMQELSGKNVLILRANTGREYFGEQAQLRGATVQSIECYKRIAIQGELNEKISLAKRSGIDSIVITSGEILKALVDNTDENDRTWLFECDLFVVGQRIARLATRLGWSKQQIWVSDKADNNSLFEVLLKKRGES